MRVRLTPFRLLARALVASALFTSIAAAAMADTSQPPAAHVRRNVVNPFVRSRRFVVPQSTQAGLNFVIRDLGLPLPLRTAPLGTLVPTPYAINQQGDVALNVSCAAAGCGNVQPAGGAQAYVFDNERAKWIALAQVPGQPNPGPADVYIPYALNGHGRIAGALLRTTGGATMTTAVNWMRHGAAGSTVAVLDPTPGDQSTAYGISDTGIAVGSVYTGRYQPNNFEMGSAVRFTGTAPVVLAPNVSGGGNSDAYGINGSGLAVGDIGAGEAAVFANGVGIAIPQQEQCPPPYDECDQNLAVAVNRAGDVLGNIVSNYFDLPTQSYVGFLWQNGSLRPLAPSCFDNDCPIQYQPGDSDYVVALNDRDDFVGRFDGAPWVSFSPVGDANGLLPPNSGWTILNVVAINNRRQIVGQGYRAGYGTALRTFLLEPRH